jgi:hypothetical protein
VGKPHAKRDRDLKAEECPVCGVGRGQRCMNYKGRPKAPCRITIKPPPPPARTTPPMRQRELFPEEEE